ncbi:caspase family protein [Nucisporomicrobium flavum]|uniref:caspase family protein n=1 Tax=Nucisporomicrobium flavum TaxID=2785915 RepID=UPI0018F5BDF2|nr:caspase family protein [Nucisporomicrobium flavum]
MTRKALLIGAETGGLGGVLNDVEAMAGALEPRGFRVERLVTPDATRAAILDGYEKLIADAAPDDAFVIYYSGHGGRLRAPGGAAAIGPDLQFIVPDDYADADDFHGITGVELSVLLARLTAVARNVTVVLDCCHAAHLSRQTELRVKSLLRERDGSTYESVERHVARLKAAGLQVERRHLISNPYAVRVVACSPSQSAWEGANRDGVRMGLLTDALARALRDTAGLRLSWATLLDAVRRDVQALAYGQRPEAEGPSTRQPFETVDLDPLGALPVAVTTPDRVQLLGAPLLGVAVGDEFTIMPADAIGPQDGPALGTATVDRLLPTAASAPLRIGPAGSDVPADARAYRTKAAAPALPVRLPEGHPVTAELVNALALRPLVRPADPETETHVPVAVTVEGDGGLVVRDGTGPLHAPYPPNPVGVSAIAANLQRVAQAAALRRLSGDPDHPLDHGVHVEWGRVRDGREEPLPASGALLYAYADERVYFRLRNDGGETAYVSLVDIGVSARIAVLTAADPGGVRLAPGATYTYGWDEDLQRLAGVDVTWPEGTDAALARPETVLVLISDAPVDVSVLQQQGVRGDADRLGAAPGLAGLIAQIATGATREIGGPPGKSVRYVVRAVDFTVSPTAPPEAEKATFLVDDRPPEPVRLLSPRGELPGRLAVRIAELIVHRNRALGSADIRVDAVVLTGGPGGQPVYRAETMRFSNVHDGERLPMDDVLIYHGPAVDFLDIAVWVSRDTSGSLALSALLEERLNSPALQAAGAEIAGLAMTAPHAAAAVAVLGAGAVLVNTAYELLTGVVGPSIGLYRTSLLAQEQFGIGRHERHPQDFSFTYSVDAVG